MKQPVAVELAAPDPLLHNIPLPLEGTFYPIGFPVEIHTNAPEILAIAQESWGRSVQRFSKPPIRVRIAVSDGNLDKFPAPPAFRAQGNLLAIVSDSSNFAMCDFAAGFSFCWLTRRTAAARAWTRHFFVDAIVYASLTHLYLTAVHASCVAMNGCGVLLCGPSGIGKSVLALACALNGWTFVTDDVAYLVRETGNETVLGKPEQMKFLPSAAALFPNIHWTQPGSDHFGHPFVELRPSDIGISTGQASPADCVVFLRRLAAGAARLLAIESDDAFARLVAELPAFEESVHQAHRQSLEALSRRRAFELEYAHLDDAVRVLNQLAGGPQ